MVGSLTYSKCGMFSSRTLPAVCVLVKHCLTLHTSSHAHWNMNTVYLSNTALHFTPAAMHTEIWTLCTCQTLPYTSHQQPCTLKYEHCVLVKHCLTLHTSSHAHTEIWTLCTCQTLPYTSHQQPCTLKYEHWVLVKHCLTLHTNSHAYWNMNTVYLSNTALHFTPAAMHTEIWTLCTCQTLPYTSHQQPCTLKYEHCVLVKHCLTLHTSSHAYWNMNTVYLSNTALHFTPTAMHTEIWTLCTCSTLPYNSHQQPCILKYEHCVLVQHCLTIHTSSHAYWNMNTVYLSNTALHFTPAAMHTEIWTLCTCQTLPYTSHQQPCILKYEHPGQMYAAIVWIQNYFKRLDTIHLGGMSCNSGSCSCLMCHLLGFLFSLLLCLG